MKEKIFKNFSLKVLSVVCAIILWTIIVNVNDPNTGYTFSNVTVQLINTESLTDNGYTYEIVDGGKISVYVSGPKSVVTDLKASDIVATADLIKVTAYTEYVDIKVQIVKDGQARTDVEAMPKTSAVRLNIENRTSQTFNVNIENTGALADGYSIVSQNVSPNTVRITGASSVITTIDTVKAVVDVNGFYGDITQTVPLTLVDIDGNALSMEGLELSKTEVDYSAQIQQTKKVPVKYNLSGSVADGYSLGNVQLSQEEVVLAGNSNLLDSIHEVLIPADTLNVSGLKADKTFTVEIAKLVPEGVVPISNKSVLVTVKVSNSYAKDIKVGTSQIQFSNLGASLKAVPTETELTISVKGDKTLVDALTTSDIKMVVDVAGLTEGTHSVTVAVTLPTGCTLNGNVTVQITISNGNQTTQDTQQTTAAQ
ncbi:MAG: CdaR family protein [Lachnospira sp.]|nr:CdaR family protein [Lachnospira sp.]